VFGPSAGASAKKRPWTYFLSHHYQRGHEYRYSWRKCKADNDLQSQSHLAVSVRESTNDNNNAVEEEIQPNNQNKDTEVQVVAEESNNAMEHEISDDIDFGVGNDIESKIGDDDSLECTGPQQLNDFQANCFIVEMHEEIIEEKPEELPDLESGTVNSDDSTVDSDKTLNVGVVLLMNAKFLVWTEHYF
jgi:hypothetical protein